MTKVKKMNRISLEEKLLEVVKKGFIGATTRILDKGVNVNYQCTLGNTALHIAANELNGDESHVHNHKDPEMY